MHENRRKIVLAVFTTCTCFVLARTSHISNDADKSRHALDRPASKVHRMNVCVVRKCRREGYFSVPGAMERFSLFLSVMDSMKEASDLSSSLLAGSLHVQSICEMIAQK